MTSIRIPTSAVAPWDEFYVDMLGLESEWRLLCAHNRWRCLRNFWLVLLTGFRLARARRLAGELYAARQCVAFLVSTDSVFAETKHPPDQGGRLKGGDGETKGRKRKVMT